MIAQFLKAKMIEYGMSPADLALAAHVPLEDIDLLLEGKPFLSVVKAESVLRYFGAELAVGSGGEIWAEGKWPALSVQENLFELFRQGDPELRRPGQMGTGPLAFLLHFMDASSLEQSKLQLIRGIEYYEPRITVIGLAIAEQEDRWDLCVSYFEHEGKTRGNFVFPCRKPKEGSELPEALRRKAFEEFVLQGKISAALGVIESARWQLEQPDGEFELTLVLLKTVDSSILDEPQKKVLFETIAEVGRARLELSKRASS